MNSNFLVVIPTYNESQNITRLIDLLSTYDFHIVVIDDNSPDNTFELVKKHKNFGVNLFGILRTSNRGYGRSVVEGFKYAILKNYQFVVQMDSDFSHSIDDLTKMVEKSKNFDLVIGSRYVKGGKIYGWGKFRKILSKYANKLAKFSTKLEILDLTSGFRIYSINLIKKIEFEKINSNGYSFLIEILSKIPNKDYKVIEYPITFRDRVDGKSKMNLKIIIESVVNLIKIFFR